MMHRGVLEAGLRLRRCKRTLHDELILCKDQFEYGHSAVD